MQTEYRSADPGASFSSTTSAEAPPRRFEEHLLTKEIDRLSPSGALLFARTLARQNGPEWLLSVFQNSLVPWKGKVSFTLWNGTHHKSISGTPKKRGKGRSITESLSDYARRVQLYAQEFRIKGHGSMIAHGLSRYRGSSDAECLSRHWIYCDADEVGDWEHILRALNAIGCSYFAQRSGSHKPEAPKFHLELPLATPVVPLGSPDDCESWPTWKLKVREWKHDYYRPRLGFLLGLLSELGQLDLYQVADADYSHLGFDAKNDRLLCLNYWGCRRSEDAPTPEIRFQQTKLTLDWERLLENAGFSGLERPAKAQKPTKAPLRSFLPLLSTPLVIDGLEGQAALHKLALGLLPSLATLPQRGGVFRSLAGALLRRGVLPEELPDFFRSLSAALGEPPNKQKDRADLARNKARDFQIGIDVAGYNMLKDEFPSVATALDALVPPPRGASRARSLADALGTFTEVSLDEATRQLDEAFQRAVADEGLHVVRITEGAGKSTAALRFAEQRAAQGLKTAFATYSHQLADELAGKLSRPVERLRSVIAAKTDGEPDCKFHGQLKLLAKSGQNPITALCMGLGAKEGGGNLPCPFLRTCPAHTKLGSLAQTQASIAVGVTDHIQDLIAWLGDGGLLFLDEDPGAVETFTLSTADLDRALEQRDRFQFADVAWRNVFLRLLRAGLHHAGRLARDHEESERANHAPLDLAKLLQLGAQNLHDTFWDESARRFYGTTHPLDILNRFASDVAFKELKTKKGEKETKREQWAPYRSGSVLRRIHHGSWDHEEAERFEHASKVHADVAQLAAAHFGHRGERALLSLELPHESPTAPRNNERENKAEPLLRIVRWRPSVAAAIRWAKRGGAVVLLDATAQPLLLNALAGAQTPGNPSPVEMGVDEDGAPCLLRRQLPFTDIRVQDAVPAKRLLLFCSHSTRRALLPYHTVKQEPVTRLLANACREVLAWAHEKGREAPVVGLISWQALLETLCHEWWALEAFWDFHQAGGTLFLPENGYFGNLRGRNDWIEGERVDALITLGDDRPNLGAVTAVAAALGLEAEFQNTYDQLAAGNLSQAHGRLRCTRTDRELLLVHVGAVIPGSWDSRIETKELPLGRPSLVSDEDLLSALEEHQGNIRAAANSLGLSVGGGNWARFKSFAQQLINPSSGTTDGLAPRERHDGDKPALVVPTWVENEEQAAEIDCDLWEKEGAETNTLSEIYIDRLFISSPNIQPTPTSIYAPVKAFEGMEPPEREGSAPQASNSEVSGEAGEGAGSEAIKVGNEGGGLERVGREAAGEEQMSRDDDDLVDWKRSSFSEDSDSAAIRLRKLARESQASEEELRERLRKWVEWQRGLKRGTDRGACDEAWLSGAYHGRRKVEAMGVLRLEEKAPWSFDEELWHWETPAAPVPIEAAEELLAKFGVEPKSVKKLWEWSKGRGVKLCSLCKHELILQLDAHGERQVFLLLDELRKGVLPWFFT